MNGPFGNGFPYVNFHEMNMDWIIKIAKDFLDQYTNIQEMIEQGETDITNLTDSKLEALQDKADELQGLLDGWYNEHSEDIADELRDALSSINDELLTAINEFNTAAAARAAEAIETIPGDYSELYAQTQSLNNITTSMIRKSGVSYYIEDDNSITANKPIYIRGIKLIPSGNLKADVYGITEGSDPVVIFDDLTFDGNIYEIVPASNYDHINVVLKGTGSENYRPVIDIDSSQDGSFLLTMDGRKYLENMQEGIQTYHYSALPIYAIMKAVSSGTEISFSIISNNKGTYADHVSLAIYGVTGSTLAGGYDVLAIIEDGKCNFKTTKNYNHIAVSVFPYIAQSSYDGNFSFLISYTNHGVIKELNEINAIINNNWQHVYSNGKNADSPFNLETGDIVSMKLMTDGVSPDAFLFNTDNMGDGYEQIISSMPYNTEITIKVDSNYRKLHFYNGGSNTEYAIAMRKVNKEPKEHVISYNKSVYQIFMPNESGDTFFFRMENCETDSIAFNLYGMYGRTIGDGYDTLISDAVIGTLYKKTIARQYHHLQISVSPYSSGFNYQYNGVIIKENNPSLINDVYNLQSGSKPMYFYNKDTYKIFKKVTCIGDSYTSGYIYNSGTEYGENEDFAFPHYMETASGNKYVNCGVSGANAKTWQTSQRGLPRMLANGKSQAYIIGLMINDQSDSVRHLDLGTADDIGQHTDTYYSGMSEIIAAILTQNPTAKIFVSTCPKDGENYADYNTAVRTIVAYYEDDYSVHCLDLATTYKNLYTNQSLTDDALAGHYTAIGYEQFAEIYQAVISDYINKNIEDFQDVFLIPYDD